MDSARTAALAKFMTTPENFGEYFGCFVKCCNSTPHDDELVSEDEEGVHPSSEFVKRLGDLVEYQGSWWAHNTLSWDGATVTVKGVQYDLSDAAAVEAMAAVMEAAPFGDLATQTTRVDTAVRDALYVDAQHVDPHFVDPAVLQNTVREMYGSRVDVVPYRLNLYWKGGHFKEHVDTPLDPARTIGTAVAMVNSTALSAGSFCLRHPDSNHELWFNDRAQVVVYGSHTPHRVPPVTCDYRVSMVYSILRREGAPLKRARVATKITEVVQARVDGRGPFALITTSRYTFDAHEQYGAAMLEGCDRALYDAVAECPTLRCAIVFVAFTDHVTTEYEGGETVETDAVYFVSRATINRGIAKLMDPPLWVDEKPLNPMPCAVDCLYIPNLSEGERYTLHEERAAYTGNQCESGSVSHLYQNAALVFYNPTVTTLRTITE